MAVFTEQIYTNPPRPLFFLSHTVQIMHIHMHTIRTYVYIDNTSMYIQQPPTTPLLLTARSCQLRGDPVHDWITPSRFSISSFDYWFTMGLVGEAFAQRRFLFSVLPRSWPSPTPLHTVGPELQDQNELPINQQSETIWPVRWYLPFQRAGSLKPRSHVTIREPGDATR